MDGYLIVVACFVGVILSLGYLANHFYRERQELVNTHRYVLWGFYNLLLKPRFQAQGLDVTDWHGDDGRGPWFSVELHDGSENVKVAFVHIDLNKLMFLVDWKWQGCDVASTAFALYNAEDMIERITKNLLPVAGGVSR